MAYTDYGKVILSIEISGQDTSPGGGEDKDKDKDIFLTVLAWNL